MLSASLNKTFPPFLHFKHTSNWKIVRAYSFRDIRLDANNAKFIRTHFFHGLQYIMYFPTVFIATEMGLL